MGSEPRHRASAPARHRGTRRAKPRRPRFPAGISAAVVTLGAVALGSSTSVMGVGSGTGEAAEASDRNSRRALQSTIPSAADRNLEVDRRRLEVTLSRSAPRATSGTARRQPAWLAACDTAPQVLPDANGTVPDARLCELPDGFHLRGDAALAWSRLAATYAREFGEEPCMTDGYRDLATQRRLAAIKPGLAARPGTSNHGWGVAVDLCGGIEKFGTTQYEWMTDNAERLGWVNPSWARSGGSRPEPWHWEYAAATTGES